MPIYGCHKRSAGDRSVCMSPRLGVEPPSCGTTPAKISTGRWSRRGVRTAAFGEPASPGKVRDLSVALLERVGGELTEPPIGSVGGEAPRASTMARDAA